MEKKVKVAIVGCGIVGTGVAKILLEQKESIKKRTGIELVLTDIIDKDLKRERPVSIPAGMLHSDLDKVLNNPEIETVVVVVGGTTIEAEIQKKVLASGKNVVTANKALLAERGKEIFAVAREKGKCVAFEASCGGGIPLISTIHTGLAANNIQYIIGILNGTCNYILSSMTEQAKSYATALKEAQVAGFAEADPTLDVTGADSAHKIAILAMLAFGCDIDYKNVAYSGIDAVDLVDINYGLKMGYVMKLLAMAWRTDKGISIQVRMAFISNEEPLSRVSGPFNAVSIFGDAVGHTLYLGRGAGMLPTASAVVADVIEVSRGNAGRIFDNTAGLGKEAEPAVLCPAQESMSRFYLRVNAADKPGVFASLSTILGNHDISIMSCLQQEVHDPGSEFVPVIIMTHLAREGNMDNALKEIANLPTIKDKPICIPVVTPPSDE
ncbi:MAG: homoserine dehydrogenase [Sedimentisphaerales bacterium]|nr:homoserine dehydrogenase [Sedimentisphaerales bacterium]